MKTRMMRVLTAACLAAILLSCGGGGGGGDTPPTVIPLQTSSFRVYQTGDTWSYSVSGSGSNGSSTVQLSGTIQVQIFTTTKMCGTVTCLDEYAFGNVSGLVNPISTHVYFLQDANGSYYEYGYSDDAGDKWVTDPMAGYYLDTESPTAVGRTNSGTVTYSDGTVYTYSYMVTGIEAVATPLGYFEAYRVSEDVTFTYTDNTSVTESNVEWYVPAIGSSIKTTSDAKYYTGITLTQSLNLVLVITGTNVPY